MCSSDYRILTGDRMWRCGRFLMRRIRWRNGGGRREGDRNEQCGLIHIVRIGEMPVATAESSPGASA